jgi:hypothetical protein
MILIYPSPYLHVVINSSFSLAIWYYMIIFKPYKARVDNLMSLYVEFNIFVILSVIGVFLYEDLNSSMYDISEWRLVVLIYMSIIVPAVINILLLIKTF